MFASASDRIYWARRRTAEALTDRPSGSAALASMMAEIQTVRVSAHTVSIGNRSRIVAADSAYGLAEILAWLLHERDILPVFDKSARHDGTFERHAFTYDHDDDSYVCLGGRRLRPRNRNFAIARGDVGQDGFMRYRARKQDCGGCALRRRCTPNMPARKVTRVTSGLRA